MEPSSDGARGALPPLYARWVEQFLRAPAPIERRADCADCAMAAPDEPPTGRIVFDRGVKCCSFMPELVNFLVGGALLDDDPATAPGRAALEARVRERVAVTPVGISRTPAYDAVAAPGTARRFGRDVALRCPYWVDVDGKHCGVWRHRPSPCATWFCLHDRGAVSYRFWRALQDLLFHVEKSLGWWCLLELRVGDETLHKLLFPSVDAPAVDAARDPSLFGPWAGREGDFFRACAELVATLDWPRVVRIAGPAAVHGARAARDALRHIGDEELPDPLRPTGKEQLVQLGGRSARVRTYSEYDTLLLPTDVLATLPEFDGRPTAEVLPTLATALDAATLRRLVDWDLLEAAK